MLTTCRQPSTLPRWLSTSSTRWRARLLRELVSPQCTCQHSSPTSPSQLSTRPSCSSLTDLAEILRLMTCLSTTMSTDQPTSSSSTRAKQDKTSNIYCYLFNYLFTNHNHWKYSFNQQK